MKKVLSRLLGTALLLFAAGNLSQAGTLTGTMDPTADKTVNLTTEGTLDWSQWGYSGYATQNHKAVAGNPVGLISDQTLTNSGYQGAYGDNRVTYTWSDGTPTNAVGGTTTGLYSGNGTFTFTVPADTAKRVLRVYVGGVSASSNITATLSDNSAGAYADGSLSSANAPYAPDGNHYYAVYTFVYSANTSGQTLTIQYSQAGGGGNVTLQAATLVLAPTAPPAAPTGVAAAAGDARATLGWNPSATADTYTLKRGTSASGPFTPVASGLVGTGYSDAGLTNGTTYYYVVTATNLAGESAASSVVSITPVAGVDGDGIKGEYFNEPNTLPNPTFAPANFIISEIDPGINLNVDNTRPAGVPHDSISARWTGLVQAPFAGAYVFTTASDDGIRLYVDGILAIDDFVYQGTTIRSSAPFNFAAGSKHTIRVLWFQGGGGGLAQLSWAYPGQTQQIIPQYALFSNINSAAPPAPTLTGAPGAQSATLTWTQPDNATSYTLKRSLTSGGPYTTIATTAANTFTDTGLTNGTTYYYVVSASNAVGTGPNSNQLAIAPVPPVIGTGTGLYGTYYAGDAQDYSKENGTPILYDIVPTINFNAGNNGVALTPGPFPDGTTERAVSRQSGNGLVQGSLTQEPMCSASSVTTGSRLSFDSGSRPDADH